MGEGGKKTGAARGSYHRAKAARNRRRSVEASGPAPEGKGLVGKGLADAAAVAIEEPAAPGHWEVRLRPGALRGATSWAMGLGIFVPLVAKANLNPSRETFEVCRPRGKKKGGGRIRLTLNPLWANTSPTSELDPIHLGKPRPSTAGRWATGIVSRRIPGGRAPLGNDDLHQREAPAPQVGALGSRAKTIKSSSGTLEAPGGWVGLPAGPTSPGGWW